MLRSSTSLAAAVPAALALAFGACGAPPRTVDAQAASTAESAEISIRFEVSAGKPARAQVLAFRATTTSLAAGGDWRPDVLGIVDPLAATAPTQGCALTDLDLAATTLMLRGGSIELQEMTGIGIGIGLPGASLPGATTLLRPFPRLYPDVATIVGGVVAEAGPTPLPALPEHVTLFTAESELPVSELAVPAAPRVVSVNNTADNLLVTVAGGAAGRLELRPFGATIAAACAIPSGTAAETVVAVPRALVAQLVRATGGSAASLPVSLEVARRAHLVQALGATYARVSVEVRSAATVELRP